MTLWELALAVALLTAAPDKFEMADAAAMHRVAAPMLTKVALHWELLDPRETDFMKSPEDFAGDLKMLQGRYRDLRHAPLVAEVERFPSRDLASDLRAFNRAFRDGVQSRLDVDTIHGDELRSTLAETDQLVQVYDAVLDARCDYFYVTYRRQALAQLRDLVGRDAFATGQLPPHVPLWRIPEDH